MTNFNREQWLTEAATIIERTIIEPAIDALGISLPHQPKVAVSIGHPKSKRAIGECWARRASEDKETNQIFITPHNNDSVRILDVLTHELIHAYDDNQSGHKGRFAMIAKKVGLTGKMTATVAGAELKQKLLDVVDALGDIPHVQLNQSLAPTTPQKARMLKIECELCDFVFRASRTQIERMEFDAPCPCCQQQNGMTNSIAAAHV